MKYYVVDAFADSLFTGNQAGVCILEAWPDSALMQNIAAENNLAETAFAVKSGNGYDLKWFTPETEIDLCGHATLATAYVLSRFIDMAATEFRFNTLSGLLTVTKRDDLFVMDFPSRKPVRTEITQAMRQSIDVEILEAHLSRDLVLLVGGEEQVRSLKPDFPAMQRIKEAFGIIVTAKGDTADFVSRFFAPGAGIPEDPVTGSSHSSLIPFWSERLGKTEMTARQLSMRGGTLYCEARGERVSIAGRAVLYLEGDIRLTCH